MWLLLAGSIAALAAAAFYTFNDGNGIAFTGGTYLVLVSTALLLAGAMILTQYRDMPGWFSGTLGLLILLDILGTAAAAYFLLAWVLLGLMGFCLLAWLLHLFADPARYRVLESRAIERKTA
ncbi:hypothetical protein N177_3988 [Lutibaculum baratangense AMV1]|uniref:Uncharacterized protein n=1 Tax=Lutibaculum baratangense AMV1 TaxID=631454 RepID=V4R9H5_9HYPH|nr:hypothetical protein N177_3988 [Lutibaculum baratangense AMV1]